MGGSNWFCFLVADLVKTIIPECVCPKVKGTGLFFIFEAEKLVRILHSKWV